MATPEILSNAWSLDRSSVKNLRNNYYGGLVSPRHSNQLSDEKLYWPTEDEFTVIFNTIFGRAYYGELKKSFDEEQILAIREHFNPTDYYLWFTENFQRLVHNYSVEVTEKLVLCALEEWTDETVKPWVASL